MRKFLLSLLLFSSPVFAEEYTIYTRERPPHQISGIIDADRNFYSFTNRRVKCDLVALGCYLKTNVKAELISTPFSSNTCPRISPQAPFSFNLFNSSLSKIFL